MITSTRHPLVAAFRRLAAAPRRGHDARLILLDGRHLIAEALDAGIAIEQVLLDADQAGARLAPLADRLRAAGARLHAASPRVVQVAAGVEASQGIVATARRPTPADAALLGAPDLFLLIADQIQDPGNFGTIVRTALAAGATIVAATAGGVDPYNPKVLRATAGAIFRLPVICEEARVLSRALSERGVHILVADARGALDYRDAPVDRPIALVVGNEARGPDPVWQAVGSTVRIPLFGPAESLNVAVAAALLAYEVARRSGGAR